MIRNGSDRQSRMMRFPVFSYSEQNRHLSTLTIFLRWNFRKFCLVNEALINFVLLFQYWIVYLVVDSLFNRLKLKMSFNVGCS